MRTTVSIPNDIASRLKSHIGEGSLSRFIREAIEYRLEAIHREAMVREMEVGYRAEGESPSMEREWNNIETEGW